MPVTAGRSMTASERANAVLGRLVKRGLEKKLSNIMEPLFEAILEEMEAYETALTSARSESDALRAELAKAKTRSLKNWGEWQRACEALRETARISGRLSGLVTSALADAALPAPRPADVHEESRDGGNTWALVSTPASGQVDLVDGVMVRKAVQEEDSRG